MRFNGPIDGKRYAFATVESRKALTDMDFDYFVGLPTKVLAKKNVVNRTTPESA